MKKTIIFGILLILLLPFVFAGRNDSNAIRLVGDSISGNTYTVEYNSFYMPSISGKSFVWYVAYFEKPVYDDIESVTVTFYTTKIVQKYEMVGSMPSPLPPEIVSTNKSYTFNEEQLYNEPLLPIYYMAELFVSNSTAQIGASAQVSVDVEVKYKSNVIKYSPVRIQTNIASDGTDICAIEESVLSNNIKFYASQIVSYARNLIKLNFELISTLFWLIKIMLFVLALGALFYMILIIVKIIKGERR